MTSYLNVWKPILINRSNRPILTENEHNLYIRDNIGLYQGKSKILEHQNGRIYLTNKRIVYFDNADSSKSISLDLKEVSRSEIIDGFLRSSAKVKIFIRVSGVESDTSVSTSNDTKLLTWTCKICSYNNQISSNFDFEANDPPKCVSCGIKGSTLALKRLIEDSRNEIPEGTETENPSGSSSIEQTPEPTDRRDDQCPKCTFINHPSMKYCELCGSELKSTIPKSLKQKLLETSAIARSQSSDAIETPSSDLKLESDQEVYSNNKPYIKLSFRKGGESDFNEHLIAALDEIKWEALKQRGGINQNGTKLEPINSPDQSKSSSIIRGGIYGLEQIGEQQRKRNEIILRTSLDDLEQLMFRFQDLMKLSSSLSKYVRNGSSQNLGYGVSNATQHDYLNSSKVIPPLNINKSSSLYLHELSRHMSEYLTNYELTRNYSIITSQDLFAKYNRYLILTQGFGTELISSQEFNKSLELFNELNLPIITNKYEKSGLVVLAPKTNRVNTYEKFILSFLKEKEKNFNYLKLKNRMLGIQNEFVSTEFDYFKGSTISEISDKYDWSYNIANEEIDKCVDNGTIVIDHNISGTFYFVNRFKAIEGDETEEEEILKEQIRKEILEEQRGITAELKGQFEDTNNLINLGPEYGFGFLETNHESENEVVPEAVSVNTELLTGLEGLKFT